MTSTTRFWLFFAVLLATDGRAASPQLDAFAKANNAFAFSLYSKIPKDNAKNLVISPFSIQAGFALLYPGSADQGEAEISKALNFPLPQDGFHRNMKAQLLSYRALEKGTTDARNFSLSIVNDVWVEKSKTLQRPYLDAIKVNYDATVHTLDFKNNPGLAADAINDDIKTKTKGLIKELIPAAALTRETALVLTNSVYFYADWSDTFMSEATRKETFTKGTGDVKTVSMMKKRVHRRYFENSDFQAVELPYVEPKIALMIILPKSAKTLRAVATSMTADSWDALVNGLSLEDIDLSLPKFTITGESTSLKKVLGQMGLKSIFNRSPTNFSRLFESKDPLETVAISDVFHDATLIVDEKGTTAAAATAIAMTYATAAPPRERPKPKVVKVDHPMMFVLFDTEHRNILFLGHLNEPSPAE